MKVDWSEDPNERRGGCSGVGKLSLKAASNANFWQQVEACAQKLYAKFNGAKF